MSLTNLLAVQPGEFVKEIEANVSDAKAIQSKAGKTFFKAKLTDGQNVAYATSFSQTFEHVNGCRVKFSGMGIKRSDDYNGTAQVSFGDKSKWATMGGTPTPPTQTAPEPSNAVKTQGKATGGASSGHIEGVTAGQALNKAVDMYLRHHTSINVDGPIELEEAGKWIHRAASMLIRLSQALQEGKLAAPVHQPAPAPETEKEPF